MFRTTRYLTFYILFLVVFASCYSGEKEEAVIFHYNESTGVASIDPAFAKNQSIMWVIHQVYNTLVEVDSNLNIVPSLAKHWEISEDKKTYTFFLRNDVFFHDDPCFPNNDTTFQLKLVDPYNPILGILSMQYCSVVPQEAVKKYGPAFRSRAVGTGPFRFVDWEEGQAMILKKNERYFERDSTGNRLPYLDGIKLSFYDSKATEFLLFRQGKLDFINDIDASFKDEVLTKTGTLRKDWQNKIKLHTSPYLNIEYFGILVDEENPLVKSSPL
ncbi:MAG: ABC transporter substrate-binding protein, partial [Chitinophagaceae bacterium]